MRYAFNASLISEWIDISTSFVIENQIYKELWVGKTSNLAIS